MKSSSCLTDIWQDKVEIELFLNVIVRERGTIEFLCSEDETLLVRRNALLVLDLRLEVVDQDRREWWVLNWTRSSPSCKAGSGLWSITGTNVKVFNGILAILTSTAGMPESIWRDGSEIY
jgi:hypothetical protein